MLCFGDVLIELAQRKMRAASNEGMREGCGWSIYVCKVILWKKKKNRSICFKYFLYRYLLYLMTFISFSKFSLVHLSVWRIPRLPTCCPHDCPLRRTQAKLWKRIKWSSRCGLVISQGRWRQYKTIACATNWLGTTKRVKMGAYATAERGRSAHLRIIDLVHNIIPWACREESPVPRETGSSWNPGHCSLPSTAFPKYLCFKQLGELHADYPDWDSNPG